MSTTSHRLASVRFVFQTCTLFSSRHFSFSAEPSQRSKTSFVSANDNLEDSQDLFEDTIVDEAVISQLIDLASAEETQTNLHLDSDDNELIELLKDLQNENPSQRDQVLSQVTKEKYQQEVEDTLEMTQIWNEQDFDNLSDEGDSEADGDDEDGDEQSQENEVQTELKDDTFWENFDFDLALNQKKTSQE